MRLLVLQHCPVTPIGLVGERAVERGAELVTLFPHDGDHVPETLVGFDGLIVLGGPMHAGDDDRYPAFTAILSLIRECRATNVPVLGLCLGAQLIARAFGQRVYRFGGLEVGYPMVYLTPAGHNDPLFQGLAPEQRVMQMHEDSFDLPQEAVLLMDARNFPRDCWTAMTRHYGDQAEVVERRVLSEVSAYFEDGAAFCRTVTDRWLDLANSSRRKRSSDPRAG